MALRFIFLLLIVFLFDYSIFQSLMSISGEWPSSVRSITYGLFWLVPMALLGLFYIQSQEKPLISMQQFVDLRATITIAYMVKFLVGLLLILNSLIAFVIFLLNKFLNENILFDTSSWILPFAFILGVVLFVVLVYGMYRNRYRFKIYREEVSIPGLVSPLKGLKIIQLSDIHAGGLLNHTAVESAIKLINKEAADLVCFTGDLVNNSAAEMKGLISVFKQIKSKHGTFSILGNHDYGDYVRWPDKESKLLNFKSLVEVHHAMGWKLMLNEHHVLSIEESKLAIIGVENYSARGRFSKYGDMQLATNGLKEAVDLKLLLSHDPSHWNDEVTSNYQDIDLTLSGHTHGGQFGFELGKYKWSPVQYFYKQWLGLYQEGTQYLYVNRGFGFLGYPGRVGILPEIAVLILK